MSGQRARSAVDADHRCALPQIPGIPWWAAVLLAITFTAVGIAYDAGSGADSLSAAFNVCFVTGCLFAVLAVRQSGVFSTVIQPPLILFVAVPSAYFMFNRSEIAGIKDILINCGYPLIERFPLMFFTAAMVLLIGMARWYLAMSARRGAPQDDATDTADEPVQSRLAAATPSTSTSTPPDPPARRGRRNPIPRTAEAEAVDEDSPRPARRTRTAAAGPSRSRHARPPETEIVEPAARRPRRPRPPVDPPVERRRRPRPEEVRVRRNLPPVERRGTPERTGRDDRPHRDERPQREDRYDRPQRDDRPERRARPDREERPERRRRMPDFEPYESFEPEPVNGASAGNGTHHPVSRVRYRGSDDGDSRVEHRTRPRRSRHAGPDSWDYDA